MMPAWVHFGLVSTAAMIASLASLALSIAGARARDGRSILMGTAFSTMTALFAVHALATPGWIAGPNGIIALAGGLNVPVGAALLALTALPALRRPGNVQALIVIQGVIFVAVLMLGVIGLALPNAIPAVPKAGTAPAHRPARLRRPRSSLCWSCVPCARTCSPAAPPTSRSRSAAPGSA